MVGAFLGVVGIVAGIVISHSGLHVIDPVISLVIAVVILFNTLKLLRDAVLSLTAK